MRLRGILFDLDDTLADSSGTEEVVWERVADVIAEHVAGVDRERAAPALPGRARGALRRARRGPDRLRHLQAAAARRRALAVGRGERRAARALHRGEGGDRGRDAAVPGGGRDRPGARAARGSGSACSRTARRASSGASSRCRGSARSWTRSRSPEELGVAKPEPEAFEQALALLGTRAEETAMVGDSLENDVAGGLGAGLAAVVWMPGRREGDLPAGAHLARELAEVPRAARARGLGSRSGVRVPERRPRSDAGADERLQRPAGRGRR